MGCSQKYLVVLALFLSSSVLCGKVCDFSNNECATQAARKNFKLMVPGVPGIVEPLNRLHEERIEGETTNIKYVLTNASLDGFQNCEVKLLALKIQEESYEYALQCPHLVLTSDGVFKGTVGSVDIDHEGSLKVTSDGYIITFKGNYQKITDEKDGKLRVFVKTHKIETEPKGKITFEVFDIRKGNKEQADAAVAYANENWRSLEKEVRSPTMDIMGSKFIDSLNILLKYFPVDNVLADGDFALGFFNVSGYGFAITKPHFVDVAHNIW